MRISVSSWATTAADVEASLAAIASAVKALAIGLSSPFVPFCLLP